MKAAISDIDNTISRFSVYNREYTICINKGKSDLKIYRRY